MRVTNAMLRNNMMLGLNKNMTKLETIYNQMNSLKKIQRPSDDPIILGRSLKLRLNVLETKQYKTNVGEARSWMEVSEKALDNVNGILNDIRKESVQASNGTLKVEDRQKIMTTIEQLKKQLIQEANANYAGRNVFGGYKTDQKVLFDKEATMTPPVKFEQEFGKTDIETISYREDDYYRIRLPYGDISENGFNVTLKEGKPLVAVPITVTTVNSTDAPPMGPPVESYYHPAPGTAYFLKDTGELIINKDNYDAMDSDTANITISYEKTKFKEGDPNPEIFFNAVPDGNTPPVYTYTSTKDSQKLEYEVGIGTKLDINVLGKDVFTPTLLRDIDEMIHVLDVYDDVENDIGEQTPKRSYKETINLSKLFTAGIGNTDKALKQLSGQVADLGSRMKRLELTEKRLGDDEISFKELLSRTEDVELEKVYIDFNTQFAVYQSALQATAKVVQPTLMDFLR